MRNPKDIKFRYRLSSGSFPWKTTTISLEDFASGAVHLYSMDPDAEFAGQYTGIKDINGVEIYEGDIIKLFFWPAVVVWLKNVWAAENKKENYLSWAQWKTDHPKVIGNIYENSELLDG